MSERKPENQLIDFLIWLGSLDPELASDREIRTILKMIHLFVSENDDERNPWKTTIGE